jgi:hypothetical protein
MMQASKLLARTAWADWSHATIAADASARHYTRLMGPNGATAILMDARSEPREATRAFIDLTGFLRAAHLAAPDILHAEPALGVLVIEDLGPAHFAHWLRNHAQDTRMLYTAAVDVLVALHHIPPPQGLKQLTPEVGAEMIAITAQYYADDADQTALTQAMHAALTRFTPNAQHVALRDFHAENLIWRAQKTGLARVGLLDYQDAVIAPAGYDLMSLLRDPRRDVAPDIVDEMITRFTTGTGQDHTQFTAQCACLSAQRNLRILGVFARLIQQEKKTKYAAFLPRVWQHIMTDLAHPALSELRAVVTKHLPAPQNSTVATYL